MYIIKPLILYLNHKISNVVINIVLLLKNKVPAYFFIMTPKIQELRTYELWLNSLTLEVLTLPVQVYKL